MAKPYISLKEEKANTRKKSMMLPVVSSVWFMNKKGNLFFPVVGKIKSCSKPWQVTHFHGKEIVEQPFRLPQIYGSENMKSSNNDTLSNSLGTNFKTSSNRSLKKKEETQLHQVEIFPFYEKTNGYLDRLRQKNEDIYGGEEIQWAIHSPYLDAPPPSPFLFNGVRYTPGKDADFTVDAVKKHLTTKELKMSRKIKNSEQKIAREIFAILRSLLIHLSSSEDIDINLFIVTHRRYYRPLSTDIRNVWMLIEDILKRSTEENVVQVFIEEMKKINRIFKYVIENFEKHQKSIMLGNVGFSENDLTLLAKFSRKIESTHKDNKNKYKIKNKLKNKLKNKKKKSVHEDIDEEIKIEIKIRHVNDESNYLSEPPNGFHNFDSLSVASTSRSRNGSWSHLSTDDCDIYDFDSDRTFSPYSCMSTPDIYDNDQIKSAVYENMYLLPPLFEAESLHRNRYHLMTPIMSPSKRPIFNWMERTESRCTSTTEDDNDENINNTRKREENEIPMFGNVELSEGDIVLTASLFEEHAAIENHYVSSRISEEESCQVNESPIPLEQNRNRLMRKINNRVTQYNRSLKKNTVVQQDGNKHSIDEQTHLIDELSVKIKSLGAFKKALTRVIESKKTGKMSTADLETLRKEYESIDIEKLTGFKKVEALFLLYPEEYEKKSEELLRKSVSSTAAERIEKRAHRTSNVDYISHFKRIDEPTLLPYLRAFTVFDKEQDGVISVDMLKEVLFGVQKLEGTSEKYLHLLNEVLQINSVTKITFRMFTVIATLLEKMILTRTISKDVLSGMSTLEVDRKITFFRDMFYSSGGDNENFISIDQLRLEFKAGGMSREKEASILQHIQVDECGDVSFMDYMAYIPLFIGIHNKIVENALDDTRE